MAGKRAEVFLELMHRSEDFSLERACAGLTDEEFYSEPAPSSWSIRRRDECRTPTPFGNGDWLIDFEVPEPTPVPITSIAWLFWHVGSLPARLTRYRLSGWGPCDGQRLDLPYLTHHSIFATAADATTAIRRGWATLRAAIEGTTDEQFEVQAHRYTYAAAPMTDGFCALGAPGPMHPVTFFVAGVRNEVSHHASQICTLRDFYAHRPAP